MYLLKTPEKQKWAVVILLRVKDFKTADSVKCAKANSDNKHCITFFFLFILICDFHSASCNVFLSYMLSCFGLFCLKMKIKKIRK